jgi:hypothetical protein
VRILRFLLRKEYLQIFRDRLMVAQMLLLPCIQLAMLANAATFEVKSARLVVVDEDRTRARAGCRPARGVGPVPCWCRRPLRGTAGRGDAASRGGAILRSRGLRA